MVKKLLVAALVLVPLAARGDPRPSSKPVPKTAEQMHVDDCAKATKAGRTCVLDMAGDSLTGEAPKGDGMTSTGLVFLEGASLIRLRRDFITEIIKSAEDL
jgi:hypothetical protein